MSKYVLSRLTMMAVLVGLMVLAAACGKKDQQVADPIPQVEQQPQVPQERSVIMYQYRFNPNTLSIPLGTTVKFQNRDPERHNINIPALNIDHNIDPNQSWAYTFETRGEFAVSNRFASSPMQLTVVVE